MPALAGAREDAVRWDRRALLKCIPAFAALAPWLSLLGDFDLPLGLAASLFALAGLLLHEHAYVQAGQSVPLA